MAFIKINTPSPTMDNLLPKPPREALFVYTIFLLSLCSIIKAQPNFLFIDCPNANLTTTSTYAPISTYQTNLNTLLSVLSSNSNASNGFYNFTAGSSPPDVAYGLFICRGDLSAADCQECVVYASKDVVERCPSSKRVTIWYDPCMIRYSNESFFSSPDTGVQRILLNSQNVTNATVFREVLGQVMDDIASRASSHDSGKKLATADANYSPLEPVYGLAQCTQDLSDTDCYNCLRNGISRFPSCCDTSRGARVLFPSCYVHYEMYVFYNASVGASPPPPPPILPPPPPPPTIPGNGGISSQVIIAIVVPIGFAIMLAGFCLIARRAKKKKYNSLRKDTAGDDISTQQSLQYDLGTIQTATNNFSDDNKIGEGGFGSVYQGLLPDGQEVAVKRLSRTSGQGALEFKNEVVLVAKLQHRSLVRLLGFCLEGEEKILIYEFVSNKSLDYLLFDPQEQAKLDWSRRYNIIGGVARGMLYLHEESRLRIIHRDLKASNILLDGYIRHGQFSTKSDVFSFGVLVLEIISGRKNNEFYESNSAADLLTYAWELWRGGTPMDLMDPTLEGSHSRNKVTRCIHIALLCVQNDPDARPSMATVVLMLNSYSTTLSIPQPSGFLG